MYTSPQPTVGPKEGWISSDSSSSSWWISMSSTVNVSSPAPKRELLLASVLVLRWTALERDRSGLLERGRAKDRYLSEGRAAQFCTQFQ